VLDIPVPEVSLQSARIMALIGERKATGVPKHVRVCLEAKRGGRTSALNKPCKARRSERRAALRREHER
jgi:hypothetical protein